MVGIALALAGADVVLTDLPHITPLTRQNVESNCRPASHRANVRVVRFLSLDLRPTAAEYCKLLAVILLNINHCPHTYQTPGVKTGK